MAADGPGILQHDLAMDIVDAFFERFNAHESPNSIALVLDEEFGYSALDAVEQEVFCGAVIDCLWQVGAATTDFEHRLHSLRETEAMSEYWGDMRPQRIRAVKRLLNKVRSKKSKPRTPRQIGKTRKPVFQPGDLVLYRRANGRSVPLIFWAAENCLGMQYYFALPNLSRVSNAKLIERFLRRDDSFSEQDLALFFTDKKRFRIASVKEKLIRSKELQFSRIGNNPFPPSSWQPYGGGSLAAETIVEFEQMLNGNGSRPLTDEELKLILSEPGRER
jgi:hypothetical protein